MNEAPRRVRSVDGILLLDKPTGLSSNAALQRVKVLYQARKGGHTGSLDLPASGLLPICLGEATKVSGYLLEAAKRYRTAFKLGVRTTTGDAAGDVLAERPVPAASITELQAVLARFAGPILQVPPMHSALKRGGQPLYRLAYQGIQIEREPRPVTIHELILGSWHPPMLELEVWCSKGTYIRALADDLGETLGCGAHVSSLRRIEVGSFRLEDALSLEELATLCEAGLAHADARLIPMDHALAHQPEVALSQDAAFYLSRGQAVLASHAPTVGLVRLYDDQQRFLGVGQVLEDGRIAPRRLLRIKPAP